MALYHRPHGPEPERTLLLVSIAGNEERCENVTSWSIKDDLLVCYGHDEEDKIVFLRAYVLENLYSFRWE